MSTKSLYENLRRNLRCSSVCAASARTKSHLYVRTSYRRLPDEIVSCRIFRQVRIITCKRNGVMEVPIEYIMISFKRWTKSVFPNSWPPTSTHRSRIPWSLPCSSFRCATFSWSVPFRPTWLLRTLTASRNFEPRPPEAKYLAPRLSWPCPWLRSPPSPLWTWRCPCFWKSENADD